MFTARAYQSRDDLFDTAALIRRVYAADPGWNAWNFAWFDIWAQRKLADAEAFGNHEWQQDIRLWHKDDGSLAGMAAFAFGCEARLVSEPGRREVLPAMLDWVQGHYKVKNDDGEELTVHAMESNPYLEGLLQASGYVRPTEHFIRRVKRLDLDTREPVILPSGFTLRTLSTPEDLHAQFAAVNAVFHMQDTVAAYRSIQQAPSYVPDLDLLIIAPSGDVAAFCTVWLDQANDIAEFEPVGTVAAYQKMGLGSALIAEASNRLRALGCHRVRVHSWSESIGANKLYDGAGMKAVNRLYAWQWQGT
ncbi:MAG: GNAT family N-acetyltransferase [Anaerolineae bacterium]